MKLKQVAAILGVVGAMAASSFAVAASYYYDYEYYSDGTYTTVVGEKIITCKGRVFTYGTVTPYRRTIESYNCSLPIP
jgi:ABC-type uncharacterized transport system substrate-binding protein